MFNSTPGLQPLDSSSFHPHPTIVGTTNNISSPCQVSWGQGGGITPGWNDKQTACCFSVLYWQAAAALSGRLLTHCSDEHQKIEPPNSRSGFSVLRNLSFESTLRQEHMTLTFWASSLAQLLGVFKTKQNKKPSEFRLFSSCYLFVILKQKRQRDWVQRFRDIPTIQSDKNGTNLPKCPSHLQNRFPCAFLGKHFPVLYIGFLSLDS